MTGEAKIDLAREADFVLGGLTISPSSCRVIGGAREERVEPRVMEVLIVLARQVGRTVTRDGLIATCWDGRAVSDDAITRVIAKLRAVGRSGEPPHFTVETLPKVGFRLVPREAVPSAPEAAPSHFAALRTLARGLGAPSAMVVVLALLSAGLWLSAGPDVPPRVAQQLIAVAPFGTFGTDPELARLARRAQDAAVRRLVEAGLPAVLARDDAAITRGVELILRGDADREDGKYALRTVLTDANGLTLWSGRFDRPASDVAGLDDLAAYSVAESLVCALDDHAKAARLGRSDLLPALLDHCVAESRLDRERGVSAARRLVDMAPELALSHGRLAMTLAGRATIYDHLDDQAAASAEGAAAAAARALAIDPNDVSAHTALGMRMGRNGFAERERHLFRAIEIEPYNLFALLRYAEFLREVGRPHASREVMGRLERLPATSMMRALMDAMAGDFIGAGKQLDRLAAVRPDWARDGRWMIAAWWEDPQSAAAKLPGLGAADASDITACVNAHVAALVRAAGRPLKGLRPGCERASLDWRVRLLARQGDVDGAFALLNGPFPKSRAYWFLFYPELRSVRADVRFMALAERLGLRAYWRETGRWPDFCAEASLPYDCRTGQARGSAM